MKKAYLEPEIEVTKFSFEDILTNIDISNPEDYKQSGDDDNDPDPFG
ncbi:MAG: hypothetical protein SPC22_04260 [Ruminococcus bromii]|nr:hypothetical protein [Ruminococcus bromii]